MEVEEGIESKYCTLWVSRSEGTPQWFAGKTEAGGSNAIEIVEEMNKNIQREIGEGEGCFIN
jgi:hypothetical protein